MYVNLLPTRIERSVVWSRRHLVKPLHHPWHGSWVWLEFYFRFRYWRRVLLGLDAHQVRSHSQPLAASPANLLCLGWCSYGWSDVFMHRPTSWMLFWSAFAGLSIITLLSFLYTKMKRKFTAGVSFLHQGTW